MSSPGSIRRRPPAFAAIWSSARFHRGVLVLLLAACVYFAIHGARNALRDGGSDFTIYWRAGRALLEGGDPLEVPQYIYLPFFAACMTPFALLPYPAAVIAWQVASFAALVWIVRELPRFVARDGLAAPRWLEWAPLAATLRLVDSNFVNGQVNLLVFAALLAGARAWRLDRPRSCGAWLGLATAAKLVPGIALVHLAARRAWKPLAFAIASSFVFVVVVPTLVMGVERHGASLARWWHATAEPYARGGDELLAAREYVPGQSLTPTLYRLLARTPATSRGDRGPTAAIADLELDTVRSILIALELAYAAFALAALRRSIRNGGAGARSRELAVLVCIALTLAPLVHKAHMLWLLLPFAVTLCGAPQEMGTSARRVRWTCVAISAALIGLTTPTLFGRALATTLLSVNTVFFALQFMLAALAIDVWLAPKTLAADGAHDTAPTSSR